MWGTRSAGGYPGANRRGESVRLFLALVASALSMICFASPAAAAGTCMTSPTGGGDWPLYGHDAANTRTQPEASGLGRARWRPEAARGPSRRARPGTKPGSTPRRSSTRDACSSRRSAAWLRARREDRRVSSGSAKLRTPHPGSGGAVVGAAAIYGGLGCLPRRRVRRAVCDRAEPLDRRGDLEERAVCARR